MICTMAVMIQEIHFLMMAKEKIRVPVMDALIFGYAVNELFGVIIMIGLFIYIMAK